MATAARLRQALTWFFREIGRDARLTDAGGAIPGVEAHGLWQAALAVLQDRYRRGWTDSEIRAAFERAAYDERLRTVRLDEVLPPLPPERGGPAWQLMAPGVSYLHPELRLFAPPVIAAAADRVVARGGVRRREGYTFGELLAYYETTLAPPRRRAAEWESALRWFLGHGWTLDELLFAIDLWRAESNETTRGEDPWKLRDYADEARSEIAARQRGAPAPGPADVL